MRLDERKLQVLQSVVEDFVRSGEPVGSRTISRKYLVGVSSATIRNEMADLEEMGLLEQPHTSAGRVPSDRGYRVYVDHLMPPHTLTEQELSLISSLYARKAREMESLIQQTARLLSEATNYLALILGPQLSQTTFRHLKILPLNEEKALLVLVTDAGFLEKGLLEVPGGVGPQELDYIAAVLNDRLRGMTVDRIAQEAWKELRSELSQYRFILEQAFQLLVETVGKESEERVYLGGTANILRFPEFQRLERLQSLLARIEGEEGLVNLLPEVSDSQVVILIGGELTQQDLRDCSLVAAKYHIGPSLVGRVGVLGPRRMEYARVLSLVGHVTETLSRVLSRSAGF
ncbi:MAG: heat-inducible transcriptional repressor HrcA [Firmicutes bacterium]|nr:heat-inducible transcriptional repressor HrcA [Bacillota bacterium]